MRVGIITIGNELLSGFTVDRNAAWIGQQLLSSGIKVNVHHTIPDDFGVIYDTLEYQFRGNGGVIRLLLQEVLDQLSMILQCLHSLNTSMIHMNLIKSIGKFCQKDSKD